MYGLDRLFGGIAAYVVQEFHAAKPDAQGDILANCGLDLLDYFHHRPHVAANVSTILIGTAIGVAEYQSSIKRRFLSILKFSQGSIIKSY